MPEVRIPVPSVPIIEGKTGQASREWRWFFHDLFVRSGGLGDITGLFTTDIGSSVQAWDAQLDDIAALAVTDGNFIVADGANWVAESDATARASLGLGTLAVQSNINDDDWSGTDLALLNGGTGASTAPAARTALGLVIGTDVFTQRTLTAAGGAFWADGDGVSGNPTIDVALQVFEVTVGQAALASGDVILLDALTGETWKVIDIWYDGTGTDFAGGGGDRLIDVTDGTSIWTSISAATLAGINTNPARWGDADLPNPSTDSHMFAASASGTDIVATYSGGATDYTAGSIVFRLTAYRTA